MKPTQGSGVGLGGPHGVAAADGEDALRYLREAEEAEADACRALVLPDLNLPKVDGLEVLRWLRKSARCKNTPDIVVSSSSAHGSNAFLQKYADLKVPMELAGLIRQAIGSE